MKPNHEYAMWVDEFKAQCCLRIDENRVKITKCISLLNETQIWQRTNEHSNSVGHLIKHLNGNISQYIFSTLSNEPDRRNRDSEFNHDEKIPIEILGYNFSWIIEQAIEQINQMTEANLLKQYSVQCYQLSGMGVILHVVEHLSYHTGQIVFYTKQLMNKDLEFYKGLNLNQKAGPL